MRGPCRAGSINPDPELAMGFFIPFRVGNFSLPHVLQWDNLHGIPELREELSCILLSSKIKLMKVKVSRPILFFNKKKYKD